MAGQWTRSVDRTAQPPALRLLPGAAWVLFAQVATMVLGLATGALLARLLPPHEVAGYFLAVSLVTVAGVVVTLGIPQAAVRLLAASRAMDGSAAGMAVLRRVLLVAAPASVPLAAGCGLLAALLVRQVVPDLSLTPSALLLGAWVAAVGGQRLLAECFRGLSDLRRASVYGGPLASAITLAALVSLLVTGGRPGLLLVAGAAAASVVANVLITALSALSRMRSVSADESPGATETPAVSAHALLSLSLPLMATTLGLLATAQADLWVASAWLPAHQVALYGVAAKIAALVGFPLLVANAVLAPLVAAMHVEDRRPDLQVLLRGSAMLCGVPAVALWVVLAIAGGPLLGRVYGDFYSGASVLLIVLAAGQVATVLTGSCGTVLAMTGYQGLLMGMTLVGASATLVAMLAAVGRYGGLGVAVAAAMGLALQNVAMALTARRLLGIWTIASPRAAASVMRRRQITAIPRSGSAECDTAAHTEEPLPMDRG